MSKLYSQLYVHCVWAPKNRNALISQRFEMRLYRYLCGIARNLNQTVLQINGMPDHIHMLVRLRPSIAPSTFVQKMKANSSRWVNESGFLQHKFTWQGGGGLFSVSDHAIPVIKKYIENQKAHHRKQPFKEEYLNLLRDHGIEYDENHIIEFID